MSDFVECVGDAVLCHNLCVVIQSVHELGIEAAFITDTPA